MSIIFYNGTILIEESAQGNILMKYKEIMKVNLSRSIRLLYMLI